jgi:hypothetical protein
MYKFEAKECNNKIIKRQKFLLIVTEEDIIKEEIQGWPGATWDILVLPNKYQNDESNTYVEMLKNLTLVLQNTKIIYV